MSEMIRKIKKIEKILLFRKKEMQTFLWNMNSLRK